MTTFNDDLNYEIAAAIREGNMRIQIRNDKADEAAEQRQAEVEAEIKRKWAPIIKRIKDTIPPWAHQFLTHYMISPQERYNGEDQNRPAVIHIPDTATVYAYVDGQRIGLLPAHYAVMDDDETWSVIDVEGHFKTFWELEHVSQDFHIALAAAAAEEKRRPELQAEADRRNAERAANVPSSETPEPAPEPTRTPHDWVGLARLAVREARQDGNQAAIAYALIGILEQLQKVTTTLYSGSQHAIQVFDNSRGQL